MSWVVVTGATARGGEAITRALHGAGLNVVVHHSPRSRDQAASLRAELWGARAESVICWEADFTAAVHVPRWLIDLAPAHCVCNASVYHPSQLEDAGRGALDLSVHLFANTAILGALRASLRSVVAVSDIHVERPAGGYVWYNISKAALQSLMVTLSIEWAPRTRCNVVAPGALPFPETWTDQARKDAVERSIPLARVGEFGDLAEAVKWLLLDATYVTGQVLAVDGGRSRWLTG